MINPGLLKCDGFSVKWMQKWAMTAVARGWEEILSRQMLLGINTDKLS